MRFAEDYLKYSEALDQHCILLLKLMFVTDGIWDR